VTLSGTNTYSGRTTISGGILSVSAENNLGSTPRTTTADSIILAGGTLQATGTFSLSAKRGVKLTAASGLAATKGKTLTVLASIAGNYALRINAAGQTGTVKYPTKRGWGW